MQAHFSAPLGAMGGKCPKAEFRGIIFFSPKKNLLKKMSIGSSFYANNHLCVWKVCFSRFRWKIVIWKSTITLWCSTWNGCMRLKNFAVCTNLRPELTCLLKIIYTECTSSIFIPWSAVIYGGLGLLLSNKIKAHLCDGHWIEFALPFCLLYP